MTKDKIIIGAGLYGLYAALHLAERRPMESILVLERDGEAFSRATYINQARVHMGYHYPRSLSTAEKSAHYFRRFVQDFGFCIHSGFRQIYATSSRFSWTNAKQFRKFCKDAGIYCEDVNPHAYFKEGMCDGAFLTEEYTYDARILRDYFLEKLEKLPNVELKYRQRIKEIAEKNSHFTLSCENGDCYETAFLLNAAYAGTNQISDMLGFARFKIKYELCEIILCDVNERLREVGLTVMDGPFFSIMPFGKTGKHSLTSVTFTPHMTCAEDLPEFPCQRNSGECGCTPEVLANCNLCDGRPESAWASMSALARKYLTEEYVFRYDRSLFSVKPILRASEIDDSRPTVVRRFCDSPTYIAVLSGKINTVYDLDEVLNRE